MHTKGPWKVISKVGWDAVGPECGGVAICGLIENNPGNAYLIAAAPDLLEALEEIVVNAVKNYEGSMDIYPEAIDAARAAIRKAKGESS
jgi:hypothetical protein